MENHENNIIGIEEILSLSEKYRADAALIKQPSKFKRFFRKISEYIKTIKLWFIAEYNIIQRLGYAFKKTNKRLKVEYLLFETKKRLVEKHGYEDGLKKYDKLCDGIVRSIFLDKRVKNLYKK